MDRRSTISKRLRLLASIVALTGVGNLAFGQDSIGHYFQQESAPYTGPFECPPLPCPPNPCPPTAIPQFPSQSLEQLFLQQEFPHDLPGTISPTPAPQSEPSLSDMIQENQPSASDGNSELAAPSEPSLSDLMQQPAASTDTLLPESSTPSNLPSPVTDTAAATPDFSRAGVGNFAAGGISSLAFADNPNVMGDLLQGSRNISFFYNLAGDGNGAYSGGGALSRNSKISDNNSPIPRTRMHFRYHLFGNGASVTALAADGPPSATFFNLDIQGRRFGTPPAEVTIPDNPATPETELQVPISRSPLRRDLNTHLLEYGFEQKLGDLHSIEFRVPVLATLDSTVHFDATDSFDPGGNSLFGLAMPEKTRGNYDFELRDISLITKSVLLYDNNYVLSAGLGIRLPTSRTSNVRISDGVNAADRGAAINATTGQPQTPPLPDISYTLGGQETFLVITDFRDRYIKTDYQTVALTPYLSLGTGSKKSPWFTNSFGSIETPIGQDEVTYNEVFQDAVGTRNPVTGVLETPTYAGLLQSASIQDQSLLAIDLSIGRWLINRPRGGLLRRLALISELHYTTTLNDADNARFSSMIQGGRNQRIDLPFDPSLDLTIINPITGNPAQLDGYTTPNEPQTIVGNTANRLDILNATIGTFMQFGDNLTFNTGVGLPLRDGDDRLFDYELQFQLNYYFDGFGGRNPAY